MTDFWNKRAPSFNNHARRQESRELRGRLVKNIARKAKVDLSGAVLDIGCGPGNHALELAHFAKTVEAFDIAPKMIALAKKMLWRTAAPMYIFKFWTGAKPTWTL